MRSTSPLGCSKMRLRKLGRSRERRARQPAGRRSLVAWWQRRCALSPAICLLADCARGGRGARIALQAVGSCQRCRGTPLLARRRPGPSHLPGRGWAIPVAATCFVVSAAAMASRLRALTTARSRLACARAHQEFLVFLSVASQKLLFALSRVNPNHFKLFLFFTFF